MAVADNGTSMGFKLARIQKINKDDVTALVHYYQMKGSVWVLNDSTAEIRLQDILYGPIILHDDGHMTKPNLKIVMERVKEANLHSQKATKRVLSTSAISIRRRNKKNNK